VNATAGVLQLKWVNSLLSGILPWIILHSCWFSFRNWELCN
jgi:hypothetical protein